MLWKKKESMKRTNYSSGAKWGKIVGYSRAVKMGNVIEISGTVAVDNDNNVVGVGDAYKQTGFILNKIKNVLEAAGSGMKDVVRTRMYVTDILKWEDVGRAHGEFFKEIQPATTMVEVKSLIHRDYLVEIEATAIISKD
jgi:enamine deaminase RidA (YjgF/YER057c/UK114 family)